MKETGGTWRQAVMVSQCGLEFAAGVGIGAWLGKLADERFASAPWLTVAGFLFGLTVGIWSLASLVRRLNAQEESGNQPQSVQRPQSFSDKND